jgi:predicted Zn-dependent protease
VSPRTRVRALVALAGLAAAGVALATTLMGRDGNEHEQRAARRGPPALELSVVLRDDAEAKALRAAERTYDGGDRPAARRQFDALLSAHPDSVEAAVGAAVAAWPNGTLAKLRSLASEHPDSGLVRLHLGLALYSGGDDADAAAEWREAKRRDPDTPAAVRAEDLLHPEMAPGRPFFFSDLPAPKGLDGLSPLRQLEELRSRAESGGTDDWLRYGAALQRVGRPVSALGTFEEAMDAQPGDLSSQVAVAVARFDKENPSAAFSRLGPLARSHPGSALVRFHLGVLLLWIRDVEDARAQLAQAAAADRHGFYGREARALLSRLEAVGT